MKLSTILFLSSICCLLLVGCKADGSDVDASPATPSTSSSATAASTSVTPADTKGYAPAGYSLVWSDEFNEGTMPSEKNWGYQSGGHGWTAKELQLYQDADPDNVGVADGLLRITALVEKTKRNAFTSTRLVSKGKAMFEEGYFEVRAKFPSGEGMRSAFWMVGDTVSKIGWPKAGEIDLVEHYGKFPTVVGCAVQTPLNYWSKKSQLGGSKIVKTAESDFHVYGCLWTPERLEFSVDGEVYWTYDAVSLTGGLSYPFKWPFYMVANVSVGGVRGPGGELKPENFPASMYIDYVRVFQK
ncbi:glycoside hydrolase family 16 protein [Neolewinella agarilytica]|nr:glycoside hydrolase family 16 protein [Neolewinella agarilytica]